ncbi:hypothetical protein GSI_14673 [Ganoderma sinense ZZ0214-1]|uniref:Uncharacterized protein n=1 Tax=Ganoderma sinense ZZ0214-1 TaxID=1077348 RepID=A0A2G8RPC7_9APHY|nr:hypothetical protein GSI_14673 [Ganoderma sinense ZZ0214-1]
MAPVTYELQLDFAKVLGESLFYGAELILMIGVTYIQLYVWVSAGQHDLPGTGTSL